MFPKYNRLMDSQPSSRYKVKRFFILFSFVFVFSFLPMIVFAVDCNHTTGVGCSGCNPSNGAFCGIDIDEYITDIITYGGPIFGGLAMLKIIYGGIMYATAAGNPQKITEAKSHIMYALLGAGLVIAANVILVLFGASPLT